MTATEPITTVQRMYAAFAARDLDALLETIAPESHWTYIGANPNLARAELTGRDAVRRFFERIIERLDMTSFEPAEYVVDGDTVAVFGSEAGTVRSTGRSFRNEWTQKYVVEDGQITSMVEYNVQVEPRD